MSDLSRALELGEAPAVVHYDIALVQLARGDRTAALGSVRIVLEHDPANVNALSLQERLVPKR